LPLFQNLMKNENYITRFEAAQYLWQLNHDAPMIIPTLLDILKPNANGPNGFPTMDNYYCLQAIQLLGEIGPTAQAAVPRLKEIARDKDPSQSSQLAEQALKKIGDNSL